MNINLTTRQKKIAKWVGYPLLALVTFVFTLHFTFPYDRLEGKIIESLNDKYDVSITSIEPAFTPGTFVIKGLLLRTRPTTPDEKPVAMMFNEIEVDIGVLSIVFWAVNLSKAGAEVHAQVGPGTLDLEVQHDKGSKTLIVHGKTEMLPVASIPGIRDAVGLPMAGGLNANIHLSLPGGKLSKADGKVELNCVGCTVGDGVAKMKMKPPPGMENNAQIKRQLAFQGDGLTVPRLSLGVMVGKIKMKGGKGEIETFGAKSKDGFLRITGSVEFKEPFKESLFPACVTFGFSEELKKRDSKFMGIEAGLPPQAKQADGSYSLPTTGKLALLAFDKRKMCNEDGLPVARSSVLENSRATPRITSNPDSDQGDDSKPREMPSLEPVNETIDAGAVIEANATTDRDTPVDEGGSKDDVITVQEAAAKDPDENEGGEQEEDDREGDAEDDGEAEEAEEPEGDI